MLTSCDVINFTGDIWLCKAHTAAGWCWCCEL